MIGKEVPKTDGFYTIVETEHCVIAVKAKKISRDFQLSLIAGYISYMMRHASIDYTLNYYGKLWKKDLIKKGVPSSDDDK